MKTSGIVVALLFSAACGMTELGGVSGNADDIWTGPHVEDPENVCYVTAFDYQDGYDWRTDDDKGKVKCNLVLYADKTPVLKFPVGDAYEVSSDAERHKVIAGNLYSDFSDGQTTVLKKNGRELYRYSGSEIIESILVQGDEVHTLCRYPDGTGFTYRLNGVPVLEREEGMFFNHLSVSHGAVTFFFSQPVVSSQGQVMCYYMVSDGKVQKLDIYNVFKVWDIRMNMERICILLNYVEGEPPVMLHVSRESIGDFGRFDISYCSFLDSDRLCAQVRCVNRNTRAMTDYLWIEGGEYYGYGSGRSVSCMHVDDMRRCAVVNPSDGNRGLIIDNDKFITMPEGYHTIGRNIMTTAGGRLCVGLNRTDGGKPAVWIDGKCEELNVNGYIASLSGYRR